MTGVTVWQRGRRAGERGTARSVPIEICMLGREHMSEWLEGYDSIYGPLGVNGGEQAAKPHDSVNHPKHYTAHPSGIECIQITEHMGFNLGNAVKYLWRADLKNDAIEDMKKAEWYIRREIDKRERTA